MAIDPVCKMTVDLEQAAAQAEYEGTIYYFCCDECQKKFEDHPENYIATVSGGGESSSGHKCC